MNFDKLKILIVDYDKICLLRMTLFMSGGEIYFELKDKNCRFMKIPNSVKRK